MTEFRMVADGKENTTSGLLAEDIVDAAFYVLATPVHGNVKKLRLSA